MLQINKLCVQAQSGKLLLDSINIKLNPGEVIGITGHSGSGKTTLVRSILGIFNEDLKISSGKILIDDIDLYKLTSRKRRKINGSLIGYIPQSPMTSFDSRIEIGKQMVEIFGIRLNKEKEEAEKLAKELLKKVNLKDVKRVMNSYPSQLSGGMLQRVVVAIIIGLKPKYVLADEPTSALDEENRKLLIDVMKKDMKEMGILLISHDIPALEELGSQLFILSNGKIVDNGKIPMIFKESKQFFEKKSADQSKKCSLGEWQWKDY
jgi:ABC-type glutathione transport system ATPase component